MRHPVLDQIAANHLIDTAVAPAAVVGIAHRGAGGWVVYTGASGSLSRSRRATPETIFDLASVSKPFLAVLVARLVRGGRLDWQTQLGTLLSEARGTYAEHATIEALLSHRAGLVAHIPLFASLERRQPLRRRDALRWAASSSRPECRAAPTDGQHPPVYSDLGYLLVAAALERLAGVGLDTLLARQVLAPLGLAVGSARQWLAREAFAERVAATEVVSWRGGQLRAVVHDDNAWALAGHGAAGHAGLFAPVAPLLQFGTTLLEVLDGGQPSFLTREEFGLLVFPRPGGTLRCGFDGKSETDASVGTLASRHTFGHLGFTGTSLWCDPEASIVAVVLTNRVNPTRQNARIRAARPQVHEALFRLALSEELSGRPS